MTRQREVKTTEERFWAKVDRRGPNDCWPRSGHNVRGYPMFWDGTFLPSGNPRSVRCSRWVYERYVGPLGSLQALHHCDNPPCVNPAHLFPGTHGDNMADKKAKGRNCYGDANGSRTHPERRPRGDASPVARISDADARKAYAMYHDERMTQVAIAREFGVSKQLVGMIARTEGRYTWLS